jgi:hypothetical protein
MKKGILFILLLLSLSKVYSSEYYGLIVGYNSKGVKILKGTCRSYPLNTFLYVLERKKEITKYFPKEKLDYLSFRTLGQTDNDDFYFKNGSFKSKSDLKDPEILRKYLSNLYFVIRTKQKELLKDKIFEDLDEIENFTSPLMTLIGILETMTENNCVKVTWIAKLY